MTIKIVSAVIPCLNEAYTIGRCVEDAVMSIQNLGFAADIIVVDNNSKDMTAANAIAAGARVVRCRTKGYGAAVKAGMDHAKGEIIVVGDGDGSYDFSKLEPFIAPLLDREGVVNGNRFHGGSPRAGAMPWLHRTIGNPMLTMAVNILFSCHIKDAQCGLRSVHRASYSKIRPRSNGFEACSEMMIRAVLHNVTVHQSEIVLWPTHPKRKSKLRTFRDGARHLVMALRYYISYTFIRWLNLHRSYL